MASKRIAALLAALVLSISALMPLLSGCRPAGVLSNVGASVKAITPSGSGIDDFTMLNYALSSRSTVSIWLEGESGKRFPIRDREARPPGSYQARFDGTYVPTAGSADRRVLPNGTYAFVVEAEDENGRRDSARGEIIIRDADTTAPDIEGLMAIPDLISPNGDSKDDETIIQYGLSKAAEVTITAIGPAGEKYLLEAPSVKKAALYSHYWNGTSSGKILKDGRYTIYILARDKAGNITERSTTVSLNEGGRPMLQITKVEFSPAAVFLGGTLNVKIRVRNSGDTLLRTMGPEPGTEYSTNMTYNYWLEDDGATPKYYERPGFWRVAVMWNLAGSPYPVRWGLPKDLEPGEEATITGTIKVLSRTPELRFWASVEQSGVGFPGGDVGMQRIRVSY